MLTSLTATLLFKDPVSCLSLSLSCCMQEVPEVGRQRALTSHKKELLELREETDRMSWRHLVMRKIDCSVVLSHL